MLFVAEICFTFVVLTNSTGLETLGVKKFDKDPPGGDMDRISAEVFLKEA